MAWFNLMKNRCSVITNQRAALLLCVFLALVPVMAIDMPKTLAVYPGFIGCIFFALYQYGLKIKLGLSKNTLILCAVIMGMSTLSLLWAAHFDASFKQVKTFALLLPPQILLISLALRIPREHIAPHLHYYSFAVAIGAGLIILEILWGGVIFNLVRGHSLDISPQTFEYNRGAILLSLCCFSAMAILKDKIRHQLTPLIILIPLVSALLICQSQSAQLMFLIGFATLFLFPYQHKAAWVFLKIGILFFMLATPFIVMFAFQHITSGVADVAVFRNANVGPRLEIWDYVSRYALQQPFLGYGVEVTRAITDFDCAFIFNSLSTVIHPHNFILQIWIEFGLLGILIAMAIIYQMINILQTRYTIAQQKILLPTFMMGLLAASTAFGMWQGAWMGALFYAGAMAFMAAKIVDKPEAV